MLILAKDLEKGEVICNLCKGGGSWPRLFLEKESAYYYTCPKCHGDGKLDWIDNASGGKRPLSRFFQSGGSVKDGK